MNQLQRQLDERRRAQRLSYPKLEELTGIASTTLWNLINRPMRQQPKRETIELLAKALDWPPLYLHQLVGKQFGYWLDVEDYPDLEVVMASWPELSERERRVVLQMVRELRRNDADPAVG